MFLNSLEEEAWYHRWSFLNKACVILAQQKPFLYQTATPPQCVTLRTHKQKRHCVNRLSVGQCFIKIATVIYCICYMALGFVLTPHRPPSFADIFSCCSSLSLAANCCELPLFCLFVCLFFTNLPLVGRTHNTSSEHHVAIRSCWIPPSADSHLPESKQQWVPILSLCLRSRMEGRWKMQKTVFAVNRLW